jgi:hypothetical protein
MISPSDFFNDYVPYIRRQMDNLYRQQSPGFTPRSTYSCHAIDLIQTIIATLDAPVIPTTSAAGDTSAALEDFINSLNTDFEGPIELLGPEDLLSTGDHMTPIPNIGISSAHDAQHTASESAHHSSHSPAPQPGSSNQKIESNDCCNLCGYRPKGDPQWFKGSMAKHKKLQHATTPPKIYRCPFPGCTSQYKNRPDNLRQHQIDKGHFVEDEASRRPGKRKKVNE